MKNQETSIIRPKTAKKIDGIVPLLTTKEMFKIDILTDLVQQNVDIKSIIS